MPTGKHKGASYVVAQYWLILASVLVTVYNNIGSPEVLQTVHSALLLSLQQIIGRVKTFKRQLASHDN